MNTLKRNYDWLILALIIAGFVFVATQRLATAPIYELDESFTLQVPYEILNHGKLALPMYRYQGGNIENVWHSLTPVFFLALSAFLKVFGFGVLQGRVFNLVTVVLTLLMVYAIGRRLFDWRAGMVAVTLIVSDQTVLERSRLLRNDYAAEALALLAFYLYEAAERRNSGGLYVAAGLAAGAGVMCHSSILYMIAAICLLMLLREGWRIFASKKLYQFAGAALAVMSYEVVYDIVDYRNFIQQYREDSLHFSILSLSGWWSNLTDEPTRYVRWYTAYDVAFQNVPRTLLHLFQFLTVAAIVYLIVRCVRRWKIGGGLSDPRVRLLIVTMVMLLFFANIAHKAGYYNAHLVTWFGLCAGVMLRDGFVLIGGLRRQQTRTAKLAHAAAMAFAVLALIAFGYAEARQQVRYLREVRNPDLATFDEMKAALHEIVPDDVCPVAVKAPIMWLAFPDKDSCFATIEKRMASSVDIDGKDYALIVRPKSPDYWARDLHRESGLLGELTDTPYGNFQVYYTGTDSRLLAAKAKHYYFFHRWRGHVSQEQITQAPDEWMSNPVVLRERLDTNAPREISTMDLDPNTAYEFKVDLSSAAECEAIIIDGESGRWIAQLEFGGPEAAPDSPRVFRTFGGGRIRVALRALGSRSDPIRIQAVSVRRIAGL